ncbi:MAG: hypothetical protein AB7K09_00905 [Planctomycetota bacterium]
MADRVKPTDYIQLLGELQRGTTRRHLPFDDTHPAWHQPHHLPPPLDDVDCHQMLAPLPRMQRVVFALTAAEMALPVWVEWAARNNYRPRRRDPRSGRRAIWRWLEDGTRAWDCHRHAEGYWSAREGDTGAVAAAHQSMSSAARAVIADDSLHSRWHPATAAVMHASEALIATAGMTLAQFFKLWWSRCRCRVPVRDARRALIEGFSPLPLPPDEARAEREVPPARRQGSATWWRSRDPDGPLVLRSRRPLDRDRLLGDA